MHSSKFTVHVDRAAYQKMYAHVEFLARVSVTAAERLQDTFCAVLESLEENPRGYPRYEPLGDISADLRSKLFAKRYRIVFEIRDDDVYVYDIQDCRQDIDKNLI